jgi:hypothetical protein
MLFVALVLHLKYLVPVLVYVVRGIKWLSTDITCCVTLHVQVRTICFSRYAWAAKDFVWRGGSMQNICFQTYV